MRPPERFRMIELRTLGALELFSTDGAALDSVLTQRKRTALFCYLALKSPRGFCRRDTLLALFWPEHDAEQARHALRQSLYFLRHALGARAVIARGDDELAISPEVVRCDATEFERAVDKQRLNDALALYQGELLPGFYLSDAPEFERWLDAERSRLRQRAAEAAWAVAERYERNGNPAAAAEWGRRAADFSPGEETVIRRLVLLLNRLGDRAAAVRAYDAFARNLEREYELAPSEETRALLAVIRARQTEDDAAPASSRFVSRPTPVEVASGVPQSEPDAELTVSTPRRWWQSTGGRIALAVLLVMLGIGTWRLSARVHPSAVRAGRERVIIADFTNLTSDSTFGDLVAHILRSELARSPLLSVVGPETTADALRRMRRQPTTRHTADVMRELAAREQINVVVEGDVRSAGAVLVVSATVIEAASGDAIYGASETARDSTEMVPAIERLSKVIRQGIGESLASIHASDSVWRFTTSSLPALRKHMAGSRAFLRGDYATSAELLEEAIALDPEFAHAYLALWTALGNAGLPSGRLLPPLTRAYELRDRLTDRERYAVEGNYFLNVTGDVPKAIAAFRKHVEALKQLPAGEAGWYAAFGATLALTGDLGGAEQVLEYARVRRPTAANQMVLVSVLYALGEDARAQRVLDDADRRFPEHPLLLAARAGLLADSDRYDEAHALAARIHRDDPVRGMRLEAELDAARGRLNEAIGHLRELEDGMLARHDVESAIEIAAAIGRLRLAEGDSAGATEVDVLLGSNPLDSLDVLSRPYLPLVQFYADAGRPSRARRWLIAYEREFPSALRGPDRWRLHRARAATYRAEGTFKEALPELRQAALAPALRVGLFDEPSVPMAGYPELARLYEALGMRDSAIVVYERYLSVRSVSRMGIDAFELGSALGRLGALHEAAGDRVRAAKCYRRLAALWRGADAAFALRGEEASRRAETLEPAVTRAPGGRMSTIMQLSAHVG